jgi:hypothetical protein
MQSLNTKRTRAKVFYASAIIVVVGAIGFAAAYHLQTDLNGPQEVVADPTNKIGPPSGKSENPITIDGTGTPADRSDRR